MTHERILALSGNDIFSGGGLHADLATYTVNRQHGFVALTCLTALTEKGFEVIPIAPEVFQQQLDSLKEVTFSAIKIGLLPTVAVADRALAFIKERSDVPVVLDPVLVCKEAHDTEVSALRDELLKFFPYVHLITPNLAEAELLTGQAITNQEELETAAKLLYDFGAKYVVIKGGARFHDQQAIDVFYDGKDLIRLELPLLDAKSNAGAGCTFASSLASHLAKGETVLDAVQSAKTFVHTAIKQSDQYGVIQYEK